MYEDFYGLSVDPFRLSPDHRFSFQHPTYKKAQAYMRYALTRAEGFVMITGRPGTGKTTLINDLLASLDPNRVTVARLATTQLQGEDFLRAVGYSFGIDAQGLDQATLLRDIENFLLALHQAGRSALLVVDEAQDLRPSALTELRLLANMQRGSELLMQAFLVGQEQLAPLMGTPEMEQFRQRIIAACHLQPLSLAEVRSYIAHRITCAGWDGDPSIEGRAFNLIHRFSQGIPRQVNLVCSRLLLHGCVEERHRLTAEDALTVISELKRDGLGPNEFSEPKPIESIGLPTAAAPPTQNWSTEAKTRSRKNLRNSPSPESRDHVRATLTPVASGPVTQQSAATVLVPDESEDLQIEPLLAPTPSRLNEPSPLDDLVPDETEDSSDFGPAAEPQRVPSADSKMQVNVESEAVEGAETEALEEGSLREAAFRDAPTAASITLPPVYETPVRDVPNLPLLPERDPYSTLGSVSSTSQVAPRRRRRAAVGVVCAIGLAASAYVYKQGYIETWWAKFAMWLP